MNLELLRSFVIFAKSKNINEAARELGISQPALTLQLSRLEGGSSHPLFSKEGKKKVLTPFGRALFGRVEPILVKMQEELEQVERQFADPAQLVLRIGGRGEILARLADRIQFPGAIQFVPLPTQEALDQLLTHQIDIAISALRPDLTSIHSRKIFSDRVRWVCHERWMRSTKPADALRSLDFLRSVPFLAYKKEVPFLAEWLRHLAGDAKLSDIRPHRICEDWNAIVQLVESGLGYAFIPSSITVRSPHVHAIDIPVEALPEMSFYAVYHADLMKIAAIGKNLKLAP